MMSNQNINLDVLGINLDFFGISLDDLNMN